MDEELGTPIYMVCEWDDYYPAVDNALAIFFNREDAEVFLMEYKDSIHPDDMSWQNFKIVERKVR